MATGENAPGAGPGGRVFPAPRPVPDRNLGGPPFWPGGGANLVMTGTGSPQVRGRFPP